MKYIANPVEADAFEILHVGELRDDGSRLLELNEGCGRARFATKEMLARMTPIPGDYWVVQSDGYIYLNPKEVFERKYSPKTELRERIDAFVTARDALVRHICKDFDSTLGNAILEDLGARH